MKKLTEQTVKVVSGYVCDKCGLDASIDNEKAFEAQEFLIYEHQAGYASIFGDGNLLTIELCQHCVKDILGSWIKVSNPESLEGFI